MVRSGSAPPSAVSSILRDAGIYALVAFGLCVPIISYRTEAGPGTDLILLPRWGLVAALCAAIFALRVVQRLILLRRDARRALSPAPAQATEAVGAEPNAGPARVDAGALGLHRDRRDPAAARGPRDGGASGRPATGSTSAS